MDYWFCYNTSTGAITAQYLTTNTAMQAPSGQGLFGPFPQARASATVVMAFTYPYRYLVQSGALVEQPYWTATATASMTTSGEYTLAATLNNPPSTPPTSATFTVAAGTISAAITSNMATATIQLHPSVATQPVRVQVSASGTVSGQTTINSGAAAIPLQLWTPSGGVATVGPSGNNMASYLRQQAIGLTTANQFDMMTLNDQNLAVAVSVGLRTLVEKVIPWAKQTTWSPLSLTTAEDDGLNAFSTQLVPYLLGAADLLDASGNPIPPVAEAIAQAPQVQAALSTYTQWISEIPN